MLKMEFSRISSRPVLWMLLAAGLFLGLWPVIQMWPQGVTDQYYMMYPRSPFVSWMYLEVSSTYQIYALIFPLLASLVYCDAYAEDFNTGLIKSILTKIHKKSYLMTRYAVNFLLGGFIAVFPLLVNFLALMMAFPLIENNFYYGMAPVSQNGFYQDLFYQHPFVYIALRFFLLFLFGGILASLGLALSTAVRNRYIVLVFPFLLFLGLDVLFPSLNWYSYSVSGLFLWNYQEHWSMLLYLFAGFLGSFVWYLTAGVRNETV
ncbi:hypothetical protein ACFFJY_17355 [Fictibacillus aquaticus]|uniref:Membrane-spanning protein n=1 Tax=Fictibacillus aquaticus TaxID=2021314 RepID=A0A235F5V7_9BACL|nr:hypothetical protein [Fictibacillus aquaticus]OYD56686.1 hypothetical protein CGZ90_16900 [Fictibacillus aquaticus]